MLLAEYSPIQSVCPIVPWPYMHCLLTALVPVQDPFDTASEAERSEMLGVSADYLLGEFVHDAKAAGREAFKEPDLYEIRFLMEDANNPSFYELKGLSHIGIKAKGLNKTCPRDGKVCLDIQSTCTQ